MSSDTKSKNTSFFKNPQDKVAIIGIGCRFPKAKNWKEFWKLLSEGVCTVGERPKSREKLNFTLQKDIDKKELKCSYMEDIELFDPLFFGITPREASRMDPHQRILLEVLWEAFEDAGTTKKELEGSDTGVFICTGTSSAEYLEYQISHNISDIYSLSGSIHFGLPNKISYIFDFHGPSFAIDSACSSSMVAINEAYMRICNGECKVAIVGGTNLLLTSDLTDIYNNARLLATDGQCKAFDEHADGYVRGEGVGVVILKSLEKAIEDGNEVWAVLSGTAINHGGRNGRAFTYPNVKAHKSLLKAAYQNANVMPSEVHYIETHGTGTPVGDEIELLGINSVISEGRDKGDFCKIGSLKTNIGHLEYASGVAALIKTCLIIKEKQIPKSLFFNNFGKNIDAKNMNIRVQTELEPWPKDKKLIAGISSFGLGGTNTHTVLESVENFIVPQDYSDNFNIRKNYILPLSGHTDLALRGNAENLLTFIQKNQELNLHDLCYSASVLKDHFNYRLAIPCRDKSDITNTLKKYINKQNSSAFYEGYNFRQSKTVTFLFSDNYKKTFIKNLLCCIKNNPTFVGVLHQVDAIYKDIKGVAVMDSEDFNILYFVLQIALHKIWLENGIEDINLTGYGQGELAVAYLLNNITLEETVHQINNQAWKDSTLDFEDKISELLEIGCDKFVEIGYDQNLSSYITDILNKSESMEFNQGITLIHSLKKNVSLEDSIITGIAELYASGLLLDWKKIYKKGKFIKLPNYAWQRQAYWF